jgi:hypothetical protein
VFTDVHEKSAATVFWVEERLHGVAFQKTKVVMETTVRASYLMQVEVFSTDASPNDRPSCCGGFTNPEASYLHIIKYN